jgi:hypothetical protein
MLSMLCHTILWPDVRVAGFGENDCEPLIATTLTVTISDALAGDGPLGLPLVPEP